MADHVRSYLHAAFSWGMKSDNDYRQQSSRRFRLPFNPATGIPTEPKVKGTRWLDEDQFVQLYRWLECPDTPVHPSYPRAVQLIMLTASASRRLRDSMLINGTPRGRSSTGPRPRPSKPHAVPVPLLAAELIESIKPNEHGRFFPWAKDPKKPVSHGTLGSRTNATEKQSLWALGDSSREIDASLPALSGAPCLYLIY